MPRRPTAAAVLLLSLVYVCEPCLAQTSALSPAGIADLPTANKEIESQVVNPSGEEQRGVLEKQGDILKGSKSALGTGDFGNQEIAVREGK